MLRLKEAILVEGRYDKNTLSQIVDTAIFETNGFSIFNNPEKIRFLGKIASTRGLVLLLDSDGAGFVIRNKLKSSIHSEHLLQAYIPEINGKEKRKRQAGKAGLLGVEGMTPEILEKALRRCGAHILEGNEDVKYQNKITRTDLYRLNLTGCPDSADRRNFVKNKLELPAQLGTNAFLEAVNLIIDLEQLNLLMESYIKK